MIEHSTSVKASADDKRLTPGEAAEFFAALPDAALNTGELIYGTWDVGSQRDPAPVLHQLRVTWETER